MDTIYVLYINDYMTCFKTINSLQRYLVEESEWLTKSEFIRLMTNPDFTLKMDSYTFKVEIYNKLENNNYAD